MRRILALLIVSFLSACASSESDKNDSRIDEIVRYHVDAGEFTGSVLVAKGDQIIFNKSYGLANREWDIPNTSTTKFRIGSVTKQFTAAAILLLEERGKLKLEDSVKTHYPEAPKAWDHVTVFHLLTHTSGIPSVTDVKEYNTWKLSDSPPEVTLAHVRDKPLQFEPGSRHRYSNSGYILLGYLIERISGQSYAEFLKKNIFEPLGMKDSGVDSNIAIIAHRAAGYSPAEKAINNADYLNMTFPHAAGALYSTTEDLLRWNRGLFGGKLLSEASLKKMTTPFKDGYALGIGVAGTKGRQWIGHSGGIDGFNSTLRYFPDGQITIVVLGNLNGDAPDIISNKLGDYMHGDKIVLPGERKAVQLPEESLKRFTGIYELDPSANLIITFESGKLKARLGDEEGKELFAESPTRFFPATVDGQIDFQQDASGAVTGLELLLDGEKHQAKRLPERNEITFAPELLKRDAGTYQLAAGPEVVVTLQGERLVLQIGDQPLKMRMYALSADRFYVKEANIEITFVRNTAGKTTGLVMHQGGTDTRAARN